MIALAAVTLLASGHDLRLWTDLPNWGIAIGGIAAGVTGLSVLIHRIRRAWRKASAWLSAVAAEVQVIHDLAQYELTPNGGGSLKDHGAQVPALVRGMEDVQTELTSQGHVLTDHMAAATAEQTAMWSAIEAVAKSSPPEA